MKQADKKRLAEYQEKLDFVRSSSTPFLESPAEKEARIRRIKKDIRYMVAYYFPHYASAECADFHVQFAKRVKKNPHYKGFAQWGRGLAKSVWNIVFIPFWLWINDVPMYYVIIGNTYDRAKQLLDDLRAELEANPRIIADFGELHNPGSWEDGFFVTRGKKPLIAQALGMGQSVRGLRVKGQRPTHLNMDDIETKDLNKNPKRQLEIVKWVEKDLIPTMDGPVRRFIQSNNRYAPVMVQTMLQERHPDWNIHQVNSYEPSTYLPAWPAKYTPDYYRSVEHEIGTLAARAEYNNDPHVEGTVFKEEQIQWAKLPRLNQFQLIVGHWDIAYSAAATADYNAVRVWGLKGNDFWYIDSYVRQSKMRQALEWMVQFQKSLPKTVIIHWRFESQFWNDEVQRTIREVEQAHGVELHLVKVDLSRSKKYDRILTLQAYYQNGRVYYNEAKKGHQDTQVGVAQLLGIEPGYKSHDDAPDADEQAIRYLSKHTTPYGSPAMRMGKYDQPEFM